MKPFTQLTAVAIPLDLQHVDTDAIIPARFLRWNRSDYGKAMFHDLRLDGDGKPRDFVFNKPQYKSAQILVADQNFGCGSSRESAVWALHEHDGSVLDEGISCVIAPSFGDIFFSNCTKNGVLPVVLSKEACDSIRDELRPEPGATMTVDLPAQTVTSPSGKTYSFDIAADRKYNLVNGLDDIGLTERHADQIAAYEKNLAAERPWLPRA